MSKYIHFDESEIDRARNVDLVSFLSGRGEILERSGSEYIWPERHITIRGNVWFDQYTREGGSAIDFIMRVYNLPFLEAVVMLIGKGERSDGTNED